MRPAMRCAKYMTAVVLAAALLASASGCSFIFDFTECDAPADCRQFDDADQGEFYTCSADNKCVLEPQRECRADADCADGQFCESDGTCAEPSS